MILYIYIQTITCMVVISITTYGYDSIYIHTFGQTSATVGYLPLTPEDLHGFTNQKGDRSLQKPKQQK